ncbi:MAG TPA: asparagine synthase (glutamine-hydrolyzing), partial [Terriglobales bacterium]|nr:asparagine synthase (glutamine-hydrolyzing) [Terriglobales bacterium]
MCGIAGKLNFDGERPVAPALLRTMLDAIRHRGPDDQGILVAPGFGLGHCRLAIIDLISGRQPLCNEDGSVWLAFNGEIYNYRELHRALSRHGHVFRTQSDSETIVHLYEELGEECVQKLRGMFAFALWDARRQRLFLARDRVGIKPLYYFLSERSIIFASEMKAILMDPEVPREVLPEAVGRFLTFGYLPGEETALRNIRKLPPACCLSISKGQLRTWRYWDLRFHPVWRPPDQAESELLALLQESVRLHLVSDAPLGFLLSGGLDSTSLLALAASDARSLRTFTIGFSGRGISDERFYARLAARAYGSEHHDTTITARDFQDFLPRYVWHMEEPVCEPPAVALYYISLLAAKSVKVLVSGEGGDEVFAGYTNYKNILWLERLKSAFPRLSRGLA